MNANEKIIATLPAFKGYVSNGRNHGDKKEMISAWSAVVLDGGKMRDLVTARCYMARGRSATVVYASIWTPCGSGSGSASGGGYHKASAAIDGAIESAGIKLSQRIDGVGESAIRDALIAICEAFGFNDVLIISHG